MFGLKTSGWLRHATLAAIFGSSGLVTLAQERSEPQRTDQGSPASQPAMPTSRQADDLRKLIELKEQAQRDRAAKDSVEKSELAEGGEEEHAADSKPAKGQDRYPGRLRPAKEPGKMSGRPARINPKDALKRPDGQRTATAEGEDDEANKDEALPMSPVGDAPAHTVQDVEGPPARPATRVKSGADDFVGPPARPVKSGATKEDDFVGPPSRPTKAGASKGDDFVGPPANAKSQSKVTRSTPKSGEPKEGRETKSGKPAGGDVEVVSKQTEDLEWFNYEGVEWEDVIKDFVERIGKPWLNIGEGAPIGELTYVADRKFTKEEAIDELNLILHQTGYRFVEEENHIFLWPLNEMPRKVSVKDTFQTYEDFEKAHPRSMDYVTVYIQVQDRPAQQYVSFFGPLFDEFTLMSALPDSNQIRFTGLARDVRRFMDLRDKIDMNLYDPRKFEAIQIKTNAADIERMVREIMNLGSGSRAVTQRDPRTGRVQGLAEGGQAGADDSDVRLVADERTNTILIKATRQKTDEIKALIEELDQKPDLGEFITKVKIVKHANAADVAALMNQILQQEQGGRPAWQRTAPTQPQPGGAPNQPNRGNTRPPTNIQPAGVAPEDILAEGIFERAKKTIRIVADDRSNSLIVYANKDGQDRVDKMLTDIDKAKDGNLTSIPLKHAKVDDIIGTVNQIVAGLSGAGGRPGTKRAAVLPDEITNSVLVLAERDDLKAIEDVVAQLDVAKPDLDRHVVRLTNLLPSRVAPTIQALLAETSPAGGGTRSMMPGGAAGRPARSIGPLSAGDSQVIPLDEARMLIINCKPEEWEKVEQTLTTWDKESITDVPELREFVVEKGDPQAIANTIGSFYRNYAHPTLGRSTVLVSAEGDKLYVQGVKPALDEIASLVGRLDVEPTANPMVILPLAHADASIVAQMVQPLIAEAGRGGGSPGSRSAGASVQPDATTNSLVVRADKAMLERIKAFAQSMEHSYENRAPVRKFFTLKFAQPREIAAVVGQVFNPGGGGGMRGATRGAQVSAVASGSQVIVEAPQDKIDDIDGFIAELDVPPGPEILIKTLKAAAGADVNTIAQRLSNAFAEKKRQQPSIVARFDADPTSETVLMTVSKDIEVEADRLWKEYQTLMVDRPQPVTDTRKLPGADVNNLAQQLTRVFQSRGPRPDKQSFAFAGDPVTQTLIISAPKDSYTEIDQLIEKLTVDKGGMESGERVFTIRNADASYVADLLKSVLAARVGKKYGQEIANRVAVNVNPRANQIIMDAPKVAIEMAEALIAEVDSESIPENAPQIIPLTYADANVVLQNLRTVFASKMSQNKNLQIGVEPLTNSLVVAASKSDLEEIKKLALEVDQMSAGSESAPQTITLKHADPAQVVQMINSMFGGGQKSQKQAVNATVANGTLIVKAPPKKMKEIQGLIDEIDQDNIEGLKVRTFQLKLLDATTVAQQVGMFLMSNAATLSKSGMKPGAFPEPKTNTLVVLAPTEQMPFIEGLITQLESSPLKEALPVSYTLKNVRADQIAENVKAMLDAKVAEREGGKKGVLQTVVKGESNTNRLIVFAPEEYQTLAKELITLLDSEVDTGEITHILTVENGDAMQLADTINKSLQGGSRGGAGGSVKMVNVVADAGSNAIILKGLPKDVAEIEKTLKELELSSSTVPELQIFQLKNQSALAITDMLQAMFGKAKSPADAVTISADDYSDRIFVTANRRMMRQVEATLKKLDAPESIDGGSDGGKKLYFVDVYRGDANDIVWELRDFVRSEEKGGPVINADWFGEYITVRCRENEYPQIENLIREIEGRVKVEPIQTILGLGPDRDRLIEALKQQGAKFKMIDGAKAKDERSTLVEELRPREKQRDAKDEPTPNESRGTGTGAKAKSRSQPIIAKAPAAGSSRADRLKVARPVSFEPQNDKVEDMPVATTRRDAAGSKRTPVVAGEKATREAESDSGESSPNAPAAIPSRNRDVQDTVPASAQDKASAPQAPATRRATPADAEVTIETLADGRILISGPKGKVEGLEKTVQGLQESLRLGEVIRIFKFNNGDVSAAAQILDKMFNDRAAIQMAQQQQQPQRRGQGNQGRNGENGDERGGNPMDQLRGMIGGQAGQQTPQRGAAGGGQRVRMATDPGNNYLIVKCDESDLPEIRKLLWELDIPPGLIDFEVFQLKYTDATETANNIRDALGVSKSQSRRQTPAGGAGRNVPGGNQQQMLEIFQQQMMQVAGGEGGAAKIDSVEIVPNTGTNSILVSSPPDVMKIIRNIVNSLEERGGRSEVVIEHYPLQEAKVADVLPILQEIFGGQRGGAGGGASGMPGAGGGSRGKNPSSIGAVAFSADTRTNTLIFSAEQKDVPIIRAQIESLDIPDIGREAETYVCRFGKADAIADTVQQIFVGGGGTGERGAGRSLNGQEPPRIVAAAASNRIVVYGTPDQRQEVLAKIRELDDATRMPVREIDVKFADADKLAQKLMDIFASGGRVSGGATGGNEGRTQRGAAGRRGGASGSADGDISIIGDKDTKKLLVRAPDDMYKQIAEMAQTLDQPSEQLKVQRFTLQHANAEACVDSLKQALMEYMQINSGMGNTNDFDAFTAIADPRTNSITVVGTPQTFLFVDQILKTIDTEAPPGTAQDFRVFVLDQADATTVADAINAFAGGDSGGGGQRGGQGRRGGMPGGGGSGLSGARKVDVSAVAMPETNSVLVFGKPADIDLVDKLVIAGIEKSENLTITEIPTVNVPASQLITSIEQFLNSNRNPNDKNATAREPIIEPSDDDSKIVVQGTPTQIKRIESLVTRFDTPGYKGVGTYVLALPQGQDALALADTISRIVNEGEQAQAKAKGREPRLITVGADETTNSLLIYGPASAFHTVKTIVSDLANVGVPQPKTVIVKLNKGLSAADAQQLIDNLQQNRRGGGGTRTNQRSGTRSGTSGSDFNPTRQQGSSPAPRSGGNMPGGQQPGTRIQNPGGGNRGRQRPPQNQEGGAPPGGPRSMIIPRSGWFEPGPWPGVEGDWILAGNAPPGQGWLRSHFDAEDTAGGNAGRRCFIGISNIDTGNGRTSGAIPRNIDAFQYQPPDWLRYDEFLGPFAVLVNRRDDAEALLEQAEFESEEEESAVDESEEIVLDDVAVEENDADPVPRRAAIQDEPKRTSKPDAPARPATNQSKPTTRGSEERISRTLRGGVEEARPTTRATTRRAAPAPVEKDDSEDAVETDLPDDAQPVRAPVRMNRRPANSRPQPEMADDEPSPRSTQPSGRLSRPIRPNHDEDAPAAESQPVEIIDPAGALVGTLRHDVSATPLDGQTLIITGDEADVEYVQNLLKLMESEAIGGRFEVFPLEYQKAAALKPIIEQVMRGLVEQVRTPGPSDRFSVNAEPRSNSLIISASDAYMDDIEALIEALDKDQIGTETAIIPLEHISAADAAAVLGPTVEKLNKMSEVPANQQASIDPVPRSNSLIVIGLPDDINRIESLVKNIDVELSDAKAKASFVRGEMLIVNVKNGSAEDIAKLLTDMIKAEQDAAAAGAGGSGGQGGSRRGGPPPVRILRLKLADGRELPDLNLEKPIKVLADKSTNSLLIYSSPENGAALQEIVAVLDTLPPADDTDVRVFNLQYAAAETVAQVVQDALDKGKGALRRPVEGKGDGVDKGVMPSLPEGVASRGLPYQIMLQSDARSNLVIAIGRRDAVLLATGLIRELDKPTFDLGVKSYVMQLENIPAVTLSERLTELLKQRSTALGTDKNAARDSAVIVPDERSNLLIILATEEVYEFVRGLATQLDVTARFPYVDIQLRRVKNADVQKLAGLVQEVFDKKKEAVGQVGGKNESKDTLSIFADSRSNSLVLTGTRDYINEADRLIGQMDQPFQPSVEFRVRPVVLGSAPAIAAQLQQMIEKALVQKDTKFSGTPMYVSADPLTNSLLLAASSEDLTTLERWTEILDRPPQSGLMTRVIPLKRGNAETVSKAVQDLFKNTGSGSGSSGSGGGGGSARNDVTITFDSTVNSVIAFGPPGVINDVVDMIEKLDRTEPAAGAVLRIFSLEQATATAAAELLSAVLEGRGGAVGGTSGRGTSGGGSGGSTSDKDKAKQPLVIYQHKDGNGQMETYKALRSDVVVIADERTNSLVVLASPDSMPLMESLVDAIDVPPNSIQVKVFALRNGDAEQMVKTLEALLDASKSASSSSGSVSRTGGAGGTLEAERTISFGDGTSGGAQEIVFTTDTRTNSVIAAGTRGYLELAEKLILELDTVPIKDRKTMVYSPGNNTAEIIAASIKEYSEAEKARLQEMGEEVSLQRKMEREITAIPNADANRILLSYDPRYEDTVMNMVHDLDQPPAQVMIQVLIIEVSINNTFDLGVEFAFQDLQYTKAGPTDTTTFDYVGGTDVGAAAAGLGGFTFTITGADFNFLLRTLQSESSLNVLSRPQIIAMDNQEAVIEVTNDFPYVTATATTEGGVTTTSVAREPIGIILTVTPTINPDGYVRMKVRQEVSDFQGSTISVGPGVTAPVFFRRVADTTVTVKDDETVVLGGLIQTREESREDKVPLVGDIPGVGSLFRYQRNEARKSELLLVLTPRVIRAPEDFRSISERERDLLHSISEDVLTSPLMQSLKETAEELRLKRNQELNGTNNEPAPDPQSDEEEQDAAPNSYGPVRRAPADDPDDGESEEVDPDSYDIPARGSVRRN